MNNFVCDECIWYNNTVYLLHVEVASAQRVRIWRVQCGDLEYVSFNWTFQDTNRNSIKGSGEFLDTVERSVRRSGLEKLCRGCADGREVLLQFGDQMWGRGGTNSPRQPLPKASWSRDFCENLHGPKSSEPPNPTRVLHSASLVSRQFVGKACVRGSCVSVEGWLQGVMTSAVYVCVCVCRLLLLLLRLPCELSQRSIAFTVLPLAMSSHVPNELETSLSYSLVSAGGSPTGSEGWVRHALWNNLAKEKENKNLKKQNKTSTKQNKNVLLKWQRTQTSYK